MEVLKLLKIQNKYLEKFLNLSEDSLSLFIHGDYSSLSQFEKKREAIIKALTFYDRKITDSVYRLSNLERTEELLHNIRLILKSKNSLIQRIIENDQKIINEIQKEQNLLNLEIQASNKAHQMVKKFKSNWINQSGETLDGQI